MVSFRLDRRYRYYDLGFTIGLRFKTFDDLHPSVVRSLCREILGEEDESETLFAHYGLWKSYRSKRYNFFENDKHARNVFLRVSDLIVIFRKPQDMLQITLALPNKEDTF
jgi:hypothetical protein